MMQPTCDICDQYYLAIDNVLICPDCGYSPPITSEQHIVTDRIVAKPIEVLEEGTVVIVNQRHHVWHDEIAVICGVKHRFYRIELLGKKTWVPYEWVIAHEPT